MQFDIAVDARNLSCPLPILRAKKALASMHSGQVLKILATDRGSVADFSAFAQQTGNTLLAQEEQEGSWIFYLRRR